MTATAVKERPILFSGPMVRAILDGRKTQTRRVVSARNSTVLGYPGSRMWDHLHFDYHKDGYKTYPDGPNSTMFGCGPGVQYLHVPAWAPEDGEENVVSYRVRPVYEIGQRLWVRENFQYVEAYDGYGIAYQTDGKILGVEYDEDEDGEPVPPGRLLAVERRDVCDCTWRPSIHLPRWASRITLEITEVRVERLNEISEYDARHEGYESAAGFLAGEWAKSLGGNPWVWAIRFRKVD